MFTKLQQLHRQVGVCAKASCTTGNSKNSSPFCSVLQRNSKYRQRASVVEFGRSVRQEWQCPPNQCEHSSFVQTSSFSEEFPEGGGGVRFGCARRWDAGVLRGQNEAQTPQPLVVVVQLRVIDDGKAEHRVRVLRHCRVHVRIRRVGPRSLKGKKHFLLKLLSYCLSSPSHLYLSLSRHCPVKPCALTFIAHSACGRGLLRFLASCARPLLPTWKGGSRCRALNDHGAAPTASAAAAAGASPPLAPPTPCVSLRLRK